TYSLGHIAPSDPADQKTLASRLLDIVESTAETEIVAHALWALVTLVRSTDLNRLQQIKASGRLHPARLKTPTRHAGDAAPERCSQYLDALIARVTAEKAAPQ
ncbi:MAG TPA: hypothetical protein VF698_17795, partial [Thermoanaerobaculia bacterium]